MILNNNEVIIRCPIHKNIHVNDYIVPIIDSKEFQRLRRISQMGSTTQLYPSATHNRFTHSLGAYEIARKITFDDNKTDFSDYDKKLFIISALLHDLGHGPLSHSFEVILGNHDSDKWKMKISHEDFTQKIILDKNTEIHNELIKIHPNLPSDVVKVLTKKYKNTAISILISSQVDVDRMDYLLRDSYYTGTEYGNYDLEWILRCMVIKNKEVFYFKKGVQALENYLFGRYFAYEQVYFHPKSLAYEVHLSSIIERYKFLVLNNYIFINKHDEIIVKAIFQPEHLSVEEYLRLDDNSFLNFIFKLEKENDATLKNLVCALRKHRTFSVSEYSEENFNRIKKTFTKSSEEEKNYFLSVKEQEYSIYKHYSNKIYNIRILDEQNVEKSWSSVSNLFNSKKAKVSKKKYIFYLKLN